MTKIVTTTIPDETYARWKNTRLKLNNIIEMGLQNATQAPGYIGRIQELEQGNDKLQRKITVLMTRVNQLEGAI